MKKTEDKQNSMTSARSYNWRSSEGRERFEWEESLRGGLILSTTLI
jgi:hypothetical protein